MESDAPLAASKHRRSARRSAFRSLVLPVGNQIHGEDNAERVESDSAAASLPGSSIIDLQRDTPSTSLGSDLNLPDEDNEILAHANPILGNAKLSDQLF